MTQSVSSPGRVVVLGINGHIGHYAARAFSAAGWIVSGFGRSNRQPISGVQFIQGDAASVADLRVAVADADVIVNALNLPYADWFGGRKEALMARVVEAIGPKSGKTMLFPANIYNYAASDAVIRPETPQRPQTPRGAVRVRTEALLEAAAERGDFQLISVRAGDFYAPSGTGYWFDLMMLREAAKGRFTVPGRAGTGHAWAYLPDLAAVFERLAQMRTTLGQTERFHFAGHYVTPEAMAAAIRAAAPGPLREVAMPWGMLQIVGLFAPTIREVLKMRYLWENPMALSDPRLEALLGAGFGTPFEAAVAAAVRPFFAGAGEGAGGVAPAPVRT